MYILFFALFNCSLGLLVLIGLTQNLTKMVMKGGGVQSPGHVPLFRTPGTVAHQAPLSFTIIWSLLKFMSTESVMLSVSSSVAPSFAFSLSQHQDLFR